MIRISLLPYIFLEIVMVVLYILEFGFLSFFAEVFLSAIIGVILILNYGFSNLFNIINYFNIKDIFGSLGIAVGGFALIIPGVISDIFGIILIIIAMFWKLKFKTTKSSQSRQYSDDEIIDVEIIEER